MDRTDDLHDISAPLTRRKLTRLRCIGSTRCDWGRGAVRFGIRRLDLKINLMADDRTHHDISFTSTKRRRFKSPYILRATHDNHRSNHGHFGRRYSCARHRPAACIPFSCGIALRPIAVLPDAGLFQRSRWRAGNLRLFRLSPMPAGRGGYQRQLRSEQRLPRRVALEPGYGVELALKPFRLRGESNIKRTDTGPPQPAFEYQLFSSKLPRSRKRTPVARRDLPRSVFTRGRFATARKSGKLTNIRRIYISAYKELTYTF